MHAQTPPARQPAPPLTRSQLCPACSHAWGGSCSVAPPRAHAVPLSCLPTCPCRNRPLLPAGTPASTWSCGSASRPSLPAGKWPSPPAAHRRLACMHSQPAPGTVWLVRRYSFSLWRVTALCAGSGVAKLGSAAGASPRWLHTPSPPRPPSPRPAGTASSARSRPRGCRTWGSCSSPTPATWPCSYRQGPPPLPPHALAPAVGEPGELRLAAEACGRWGRGVQRWTGSPWRRQPCCRAGHLPPGCPPPAVEPRARHPAVQASGRLGHHATRAELSALFTREALTKIQAAWESYVL